MQTSLDIFDKSSTSLSRPPSETAAATFTTADNSRTITTTRAVL